MLRFISIATLIAWSSAALAQDSGPPPIRIEITKLDCSRLVRHHADEGVAYRPGEGARGKKVAPADLPGSGAAAMEVLPEILEFPINISPVGWAERNLATKEKAAAEQALANTIKGRLTASETLTALEAQKDSLTEAEGELTEELADLEAERVILENKVAAMEAEITGGTRKSWDQEYRLATEALTAKQTAETAKAQAIDSNELAQEANVKSQAVQQSIIDAAPALEDKHNAERMSAQSTLSSMAGRGLDGASMTVGKIAYDTRRGTFMLNGKPMGGADQAALAEACAKQGVR